jgi:hypothetical protein
MEGGPVSLHTKHHVYSSVITSIATASLLVAASSGTASGNSNRGFAALIGKRLAGTSKVWLPIASPYTHPKDVAGTVTPPVITDNTSGAIVAFFDFGSVRAATTFYDAPPTAARLYEAGILAYQSLPGATGAPPPARGLDLRSCLYSATQASGAAVGESVGAKGTMNAAGVCSIGTSSSIGTATMIRRGDVVVICYGGSQDSVIGGAANPSELTGNAALALSASKLLKKVGLG